MAYGNPDPYDTSIPKYNTAQAIYDGLCDLTQGEERGILSEMGADVSWDGEDYYYIDKGNDLKEKFERLSDNGDKMWLMDLAVFQVDEGAEIHDFVYDALHNPDLAKRLDFKRLFVEHMTFGAAELYDEISLEFRAQLDELSRFDYRSMLLAYARAIASLGRNIIVNPYSSFCGAIYRKAKNLRLQQETPLIAECRALLFSYDDFIYGLRMNQALYEMQERQYSQRLAQLEAGYWEKLQLLSLAARQQGIALEVLEALELPAPAKTVEQVQ